MQKRIISYFITIITALTFVLSGCGEKAENIQINAAETDKDISKEADKSFNTSDITEATGKPQEGLNTNTDNTDKDTDKVTDQDGVEEPLNSNCFKIEDISYSELFETVKNKCLDNINRDALTREDAIQLSVLLMSYEIFPEVMESGTESAENSDNENRVPYIIDEIRNILDSYLQHMEKDEIQGTEEAENFILVAADLAYIYKKYDKSYAEKCLKTAETLWKNVRKDIADSTKFTALDAAKLYRVTAKKEYRTYLLEYFNTGSYLDKYDDVEFLIETTYLNSRVEVDKNICELLMKKLMQAAEKISNEVRSSIYMTAFEKQTDLEKILNDGLIMSFVDYVISNHEYDMILENYLHYLLGRNPEGVVYLDDVSDAKIVFMLSKILGKGYSY